MSIRSTLLHEHENDLPQGQADQPTANVAETAVLDNRLGTVGQDYPRPPITQCMLEFIYEADTPPDVKFRKFGEQLRSFRDLFRHPDMGAGLIAVAPGKFPRQVPIKTHNDLLAVVHDRLRVNVVKGGKPKGGQIPLAELGSMLRSELFLQEFPPLDRLVTQPLFLLDWELTRPGYYDGGWGQRFYYAGEEVLVYPETNTIQRFLDTMQFASEADRTNAVAGGLTVMLRNHWLGAKPWFPVTANRSHAGKGTIISFMCGHCDPEQVTYESTDWAFKMSFMNAFKMRPDLGVLNIDNIRLDRNGVVRSAFLERVLHEKETEMFSPGIRNPPRVRAQYVVTATVNEGRFSEDLMNRAVPIRLEATGDLTQRKSLIGDPKLEFLPENRDRIAGELRGMIERWKAAGQPHDEEVRHPSFAEWAREVGGILKVNGFKGFLANAAIRKSEDDPVRRALAELGEGYSDDWHRTHEWAAQVAKLGLTKVLIPVADQDTHEGRIRGTGKVLTNHAGETFVYETENELITLTLEKARLRIDGGEGQIRYRFKVVERRQIPIDSDV